MPYNTVPHVSIHQNQHQAPFFFFNRSLKNMSTLSCQCPAGQIFTHIIS